MIKPKTMTKMGIKPKLRWFVWLSIVAAILGLVFAALLLLSARKPVWLGILMTLNAGVQCFCMAYYLIVIMIPLGKADHMVGMMQEYYLLETHEEKLFSSLTSLGKIGQIIGNAAMGINNESKTRILNTEVALYALQSEINPHFLYNTLETIRNYALNYGVPEVADMTQSLATIFRYSISRPGEVATLADEIDNVRNYLKIQLYRFPNRFQTEWIIDEEDDDIMKYSLPVLTLQPLVENALNHGLETNLSSGRIIIRAMTTQSKLIVSIADNGMGMTQEKLDQLREKLKNDFYTPSNITNRSVMNKTGLSLNNVNQRIKLYFGQEYGLTVTSVKDYGTTVEITVPKVR